MLSKIILNEIAGRNFPLNPFTWVVQVSFQYHSNTIESDFSSTWLRILSVIAHWLMQVSELDLWFCHSLHLGSPAAARRLDERRQLGRSRVGWIENRYFFLWYFTVYRTVSFFLPFVSELLYFCTLGCSLNNDIDADWFQPLYLYFN